MYIKEQPEQGKALSVLGKYLVTKYIKRVVKYLAHQLYLDLKYCVHDFLCLWLENIPLLRGLL